MTTSRSSLEDICQFFDVHREFGEQDQQALVVEEVKEFGQIGIQSVLDHEMTDTSPLRTCPTSSPRCTSMSPLKALRRTLISKMER